MDVEKQATVINIAMSTGLYTLSIYRLFHAVLSSKSYKKKICFWWVNFSMIAGGSSHTHTWIDYEADYFPTGNCNIIKRQQSTVTAVMSVLPGFEECTSYCKCINTSCVQRGRGQFHWQWHLSSNSTWLDSTRLDSTHSTCRAILGINNNNNKQIKF